ncbi:MAG: lysophospholipid acyltransferase family protein [Alphaproteobacteria bacterium]|nr:lysophospholipid acyltransferase family protein [Alphaproteobacteria bacterium]
MTAREFYKRLRKSILRSDVVRYLACWLAANYIRLIHATQKVTTENIHIPEAFWSQGKPFIMAFWHGRILMMPYIWPKKHSFHMLASQHRDGLLISRTVAHLGIDSINGSTTRGAGPAVRAIIKKIKEGGCVGITPDGPKGPRMRCSDGVINIARLSGVPILPVTYSAAPSRFMNTWDRFLLPRPFGKGIVFVWGEPVEVPRDADKDQIAALNQLLEDRLNVISAEADRRMGLVPIEPAPLNNEASP